MIGSSIIEASLLGTHPHQGIPFTNPPSNPTSSQGKFFQARSPGHTNMANNIKIPFVYSLNLLDLTKLTKLTNDPIAHNQTWPLVPTKLPLDIPKFEGKQGEDPTNHIMNYHLWCSSNSIIEDLVHLRLFQRTLTGPTMK